MSWPLIGDYNLIVQHPQKCFEDPELKKCNVALRNNGLPKGCVGGFACVYELQGISKSYAVKCFYTEQPERHNRYDGISKYLQIHNSHYLVEFEYIEKGIYVNAGWFPILKMRWVNGKQLNRYIEECLGHPDASRLLGQLLDRWHMLLNSLQGNQIAHGDLQHGNVLVTATGDLFLVDYDGMYVPPLKGKNSVELGHPDYQHPRRSVKDYHEKIDEFAGLVIRVAIKALSVQPNLWDKFNNDQNLLFTQEDFKYPRKSVLFRELLKSQDQEVVTLTQRLLALIGKGSKPHFPDFWKFLKEILSQLFELLKQLINKTVRLSPMLKIISTCAAGLVVLLLFYVYAPNFHNHKPMPPIRPTPWVIIPSDPKLAKIYEKSGDEAYEKGDYQRALEFYRKAFGLDQENMELKEKLADCEIMAYEQEKRLND